MMNDTMFTDDKQVRSLPNKAFDMQYSTQIKKEMLYLKQCGFLPSFIKMTKYNVPTYKYTKTAALFRAVAIFYESRENEKSFDAIVSALNDAENVVNANDMIDIEITPDGKIKPPAIHVFGDVLTTQKPLCSITGDITSACQCEDLETSDIE